MENIPKQIPKKTTHPPSNFPKDGGSAVEQTTEPEEDNRNVTPQENVDDDPITLETQKDQNNTLGSDTQKTPEIS